MFLPICEIYPKEIQLPKCAQILLQPFLSYAQFVKYIQRKLFLPICEIYPKEYSWQNVPKFVRSHICPMYKTHLNLLSLIWQNIWQNVPKFVRSHICPMRGVPQTLTLRIPLKLQPKPRILGFFDRRGDHWYTCS